MFRKIFWVGVFFIIVASNLFSQSVPKDSLQAQVNQLKEQITALQQTITSLKVEIEVANRIIDSSNNIVEYSGWVGIGITVLLLTFGFYSYWSFDKSKQEIEKFNSKAEERLSQAEKKFNDFINSPDRINILLEEMNFRNAEKEIDSNDEKIFIQGLRRAYVLSKEKKLILSERLKSKIYNPTFWMHFTEIFNFLKSNQSTDIREFAAKYFVDNSKSIRDIELVYLLDVLFIEKPYMIEPIDFYSSCKAELKSLTLRHFKRVLENAEFISLIEKIFEDDSLIPSFHVDPKIDKNVFTKIILNNLKHIKDNDLIYFLDYINYEETIVREIFRRDPDLKIFWSHIYTRLTDTSSFKLFVELFNLRIPENWISLINMITPYIDEKSKMEIIESRFKHMTFPINNEFFTNELPLLFNPNYGIEYREGKFWFGSKDLGEYVENTPLDGTIEHPILKRKMVTKEIVESFNK